MTEQLRKTAPSKRAAAPFDPDHVCFVIGRPRSGSTVFKRMLETHPEIFSFGEVFNETNKRSYFHFLRRRQEKNPDVLYPSNTVANFIAFVRASHENATRNNPACARVVLDVKYDQAHLVNGPWWGIDSLPRIFSLISEQGWRVMDLHRDIVAALVSNQIARKTQVYHAKGADQQPGEAVRIHVDPKSLLRDVAAISRTYDRIGRHFAGYGKYLRLRYEDMFDRSTGMFAAPLLERVSAFLGVENRFDPKPALWKLLDEDVFSHIENASEIRDLLDRNEAAMQA